MTAPRNKKTFVAAGETSSTGHDAHQFELFASALSGRAVRVVEGVPGEPAWTDGMTIFVDANATEINQLTAVAVQASMISAGSLVPEIARKLNHRNRITRRYFGLESHRALAANRALLPRAVLRVLDQATAGRTESPEASLTIAATKDAIPAPPAAFGALRPKSLLGGGGGRQPQINGVQQHRPRRQPDELHELDDDEVDENDAGAAADMFSVGGASGVLGRLIKRMLKAVRRGNAGGTPGTDTPTHLGRGNHRRTTAAVMSTASTGAVDADAQHSGGTRYPEWDTNRKCYRLNWCTVNEVEPPPQHKTKDAAVPDAHRLRRSLARLNVGLDQYHRQPQGADIDIDAAVEAHVQSQTTSTPDENIYIDSLRRRRDLSVLVLLDISGSAGEPDGSGHTVHERQRAAAAAVVAAFYDLGDRIGLYAYSSQGRGAVNLVPVKRFDDRFNTETLQRLFSLKPGAYSRLGTAIRHGASVLETHGGTTRRLLIVLSDGLAYDHGYDKEYGAADARRALAEARRRGTGGLCLTFGTTSDAASLSRVFGSAAHATVSSHQQLAHAIGTLVRSALKSAEVRRRIA